MVHEIKEKSLLQIARQSAREIGFKTLSAYATMLTLFVVITITFVLAQQRQDLRQRAASTIINCTVTPFTMDSEETQYLSLLNSYRNSNGLRSLTLSSHLNRAAEWKASDMAKTQIVSHTDSLGRQIGVLFPNCGYDNPYGSKGEILAANSSPNAQAVMSSWKKSPKHDEVMLGGSDGPTYNWLKVGIARVYNPSNKVYYWAVEFANQDDGTDGSYIPDPIPPGAPTVQSATASCRSDGSTAIKFTFASGSNAQRHELIYNPNSWSATGTKIPITSGQTVPEASQGGFSPNMTIFYNIQACNAYGCTLDPNGAFSVSTGSCGGSTIPTSTPISTPTPTVPPTTAPTSCTYTTPNSFSITAGSSKALSLSALNLKSGTTDLGFTSGTDKLFKSVGNTISFNPTMSLSVPVSSYSTTGGSYTFNMNLTTTSLTPLGQYTLDAVYLYLNGVKTQCLYNGLGGLVINVTSTTGGGGGGIIATPIPTATKAPTPTPTAAIPTFPCPGGTTNCANNIPSNYYSCAGKPNYLGNTGYDNWCYTNMGGNNAYCYSCIAFTPTPTKIPPTPTPVVSAPHLLLWNAYCSGGFATVAFNWSGTNPYGYTLQWGSPRLYNYTQTVSYARSGTYYSGFSSNVEVEYQVWANNSSGVATTPSDNGTFIQRTPSCTVATPTPTPTVVVVSSCPNYDPSTGYNNICTTNPCIGGSTLYKNGFGNAACASTYGYTYGTCCMVTQPNGCPGDGYNTCRQSGCLSGETNVTNGNAACAAAYGWNTGYCCR